MWDWPQLSYHRAGGRGGYELIGYRRDAPDLPEDESRIFWPDSAQMVPELADLHIADLGDYLRQRRRAPGDLLRVQTLAYFGVPSDDEDYLRYVNGQSVPLSPHREPWYAQLRSERAAGQIWRNVHVVDLPLNDYLRYQFEWCYTSNVEAGMEVRVLDTTTRPEARVMATAGDFYVIDRHEIVLMRYAEDGRYLSAGGAGASSTQGYTALAELAWEMSIPFTDCWASHPQYHRVSYDA
ncbi:MAG: DUF6879 family protein [Pseudonocardiaceae bacterium]